MKEVVAVAPVDAATKIGNGFGHTPSLENVVNQSTQAQGPRAVSQCPKDFPELCGDHDRHGREPRKMDY